MPNPGVPATRTASGTTCASCLCLCLHPGRGNVSLAHIKSWRTRHQLAAGWCAVSSTPAHFCRKGAAAAQELTPCKSRSQSTFLGTTRRPLQHLSMQTQSRGFCAGWQLAGAPALAQLAEAVHLAAARGTAVRAGPSSVGPRPAHPSTRAQSWRASRRQLAAGWMCRPTRSSAAPGTLQLRRRLQPTGGTDT